MLMEAENFIFEPSRIGMIMKLADWPRSTYWLTCIAPATTFTGLDSRSCVIMVEFHW